jgi:hypothetical protein
MANVAALITLIRDGRHDEALSNASLHSRITNAYSDTGRPRRCMLARLGAIDFRAQTQIPTVC